MTYKGHVRNGVVVLEAGARLPEDAEVEVILAPEDQASEESLDLGEVFLPYSGKGSLLPPPPSMPATRARQLSEVLAEVIGSVPDYPSDYAENLDHYLHGARKR